MILVFPDHDTLRLALSGSVVGADVTRNVKPSMGGHGHWAGPELWAKKAAK